MGKNSHIENIGLNHIEVKKAINLIGNKKIDTDEDFIIEGCWAYEKLMQSGIEIETLLFCPEFITEEKEYKLVSKLVDVAENSYEISGKVCKRISDRDKPEGCFFICKLPKYSLSSIKIRGNNIVVILDGLEKPGNIGTIIRSADAAGGDAVIICNSKVRLTHYRLIKASMGSSLTLPIIEAEMEELITWLRKNGFRILLTDLKATQSCYETDYNGRIAIVAGNEIRGISEVWQGQECERIIIPMFGSADSLNVGFAATLVAYEAALAQRAGRNKHGFTV